MAAKLSRRGALLARIGVVRIALTALASGDRIFPKLIARISAGRGTDVILRLIGEIQKLPQQLWPTLRAHWSRPKCFRAMAAYLEALPENARTAILMPIPSTIPFIVLSASSANEAELKERNSWIQQSPSGRHIRIEESGHWLQLERPDVVIAAIQELVGWARDEKKAPMVN
jgi:pimeloyl-ACP methyl ester carboxylesterase